MKGLSTVATVGLILLMSACASCGTLLFVRATGYGVTSVPLVSTVSIGTGQSLDLVPLNSTIQRKVLHVGDSLGSDYIITGLTGSPLSSNLIITDARTGISFSPKALYIATNKEFQTILSGTTSPLFGTSFRLYGRLYNAYYNDGIGICVIPVTGV